MLPSLPQSIIAGFLFTVVLTFILFVNAVKNKIPTAVFLFFWLMLTGILSFKEIFLNTTSLPPRLLLVMIPPIACILILLIAPAGKKFTDQLSLRRLTLVHIVRLPVEITLYLLAAHKLVPELMTFSGRNFDILSGVSAPIIFLICFKNGRVRNKPLLLIWNVVCLGLLINIVVNAILSAPFPFQRFAFDQPNVAVLYFPFTWLPCFIVVIVLYCQLAAIRQLTRR